MLDFLIMLWMTIGLIVEIPKILKLIYGNTQELIQELKDLERIKKGDIRQYDIEKFILK